MSKVNLEQKLQSFQNYLKTNEEIVSKEALLAHETNEKLEACMLQTQKQIFEWEKTVKAPQNIKFPTHAELEKIKKHTQYIKMAAKTFLIATVALAAISALSAAVFGATGLAFGGFVALYLTTNINIGWGYIVLPLIFKTAFLTSLMSLSSLGGSLLTGSARFLTCHFGAKTIRQKRIYSSENFKDFLNKFLKPFDGVSNNYNLEDGRLHQIYADYKRNSLRLLNHCGL